jgi:hypothetical protein
MKKVQRFVSPFPQNRESVALVDPGFPPGAFLSEAGAAPKRAFRTSVPVKPHLGLMVFFKTLPCLNLATNLAGIKISSLV